MIAWAHTHSAGSRSNLVPSSRVPCPTPTLWASKRQTWIVLPLMGTAGAMFCFVRRYPPPPPNPPHWECLVGLQWFFFWRDVETCRAVPTCLPWCPAVAVASSTAPCTNPLQQCRTCTPPAGGASLEGEGGFGGNTRAAAERSQGNMKGVGGWLLAVANAVGLALGYGNAFWAESGPESWGGGGHPLFLKRFPARRC